MTNWIYCDDRLPEDKSWNLVSCLDPKKNLTWVERGFCLKCLNARTKWCCESGCGSLGVQRHASRKECDKYLWDHRDFGYHDTRNGVPERCRLNYCTQQKTVPKLVETWGGTCVTSWWDTVDAEEQLRYMDELRSWVERQKNKK